MYLPSLHLTASLFQTVLCSPSAPRQAQAGEAHRYVYRLSKKTQTGIFPTTPLSHNPPESPRQAPSPNPSPPLHLQLLHLIAVQCSPCLKCSAQSVAAACRSLAWPQAAWPAWSLSSWSLSSTPGRNAEMPPGESHAGRGRDRGPALSRSFCGWLCGWRSWHVRSAV